MALHIVATTPRHTPAHRRGRAGVVRVTAALVLAIAAVGGVGAATTHAAWDGASYLGPSTWLTTDGSTITP